MLSARFWRLDLTGKGSAQLVVQQLAFPNGLLVDRDSVIVSRSLAASRCPSLGQRHEQADPGEAARLSRTALAGRGWRRLAGLVRAAQSPDRVHSAGKRLSRADDARRAAGILDRPGARLRNQLLEPLQCGGGEDHGHPQALVAVALLWPGGQAGCEAAAGRELPQPRQRAAPRRTSVAEVGGRVFAASKGGNAILEIEPKVSQ